MSCWRRSFIKGYAAPETKAAAERARLLIEQADALGEPPEDPLLLFSVLYSFWVANAVAFNGDVARTLAAQFLALAEKQGATGPLMVGHRIMGTSLLLTGDIAKSRVHFDRAIALYDPAEHRPLAARFGQDLAVAALSFQSVALWALGYPELALADADHAVGAAREIGQAAPLMYAVCTSSLTHIHCGNYVVANAQLKIIDEVEHQDLADCRTCIRSSAKHAVCGTLRKAPRCSAKHRIAGPPWRLEAAGLRHQIAPHVGGLPSSSKLRNLRWLVSLSCRPRKP